MNSEFSLLLQDHKKFGQILQPFLINESSIHKEYYSILSRLSGDRIESMGDKLTDGQKLILKTIDKYNDKNIALRFTSKKNTVRDFVQTVKSDYVESFIRPFIEKQMAICIGIAKNEGIRIFYRETKNVVYKTNHVEIEEKPAEIVFNFKKLENETHYFQTISHNGTSINLQDKGGVILTNDPCWLLLDQKLYFFKEDVDGKKLKLFFDKEFAVIPEKFEKKYFSTFVKNCIRDFPVRTEGLDIININPIKYPVLSLEIDFSGLPGLFLIYKYGKKSIRNIDPITKYVDYRMIEEKHLFEVLNRDTDWEDRVLKILLTNGLKLAHDNVFILNKDQDKYNLVNWLNANTKMLMEHGFHLEQDIADMKFFTGFMEITVRFEEKNDWFDVYAMANFGDEFEISIISLRKHLLNGIREFKLPDGRIAILPEEWFGKYTDLVSFGEDYRDRLRLNKKHYFLVSGSLSETNSISEAKLEELSKKNLKDSFELPANVNATLRSYQLEGFQWLSFLRKHKFGGCLADDMGLGKTLQTLTLLVSHINQSKPESPINIQESKGHVDLFTEVERKESSVKPSLVVMPSSLIHNWRDEIMKFTPQIKFLIYTGLRRSKLLDKIPNAHIVLTTYGTVRKDHEKLSGFTFDYVILDESQMIKNPTSKIAKATYKLNANYRLALSGTPIENSLSDLWSQMHFLNPGLLRDINFFKHYFANPIEKNDDEEKKKKLDFLINPFILRRTKGQVEKELPKLSEEYVYCEMSPKQKTKYQSEKIAIRNYILQSFEKQDTSKTAIMMVQALTKLRQLANHPVLIDEDYEEDSGKFEEVIRNLETLISEGHKVLVFSSFVKHLKVYIDYFNENNLKYSVLTGESRQRAKIIKEFQTDPERSVFFISLKAGGVGLNLTEAEYVFILDPWWNPQAENQAINRAHRIGQTKPVFAYRFISLGTIEEKILSLQRKKSKLAELFITSDNPLKGLNITTIKDLIE